VLTFSVTMGSTMPELMVGQIVVRTCTVPNWPLLVLLAERAQLANPATI